MMEKIKKFLKWYWHWSLTYKNPPCPKCGSKDLNIVKESAGDAFRRNALTALFFVRVLWVKKPKNLYVCQKCGFSWEAR
jgi:predicted RNA-binding Zn-ribbon protein involved in translation (DUF1610 family)